MSADRTAAATNIPQRQRQQWPKGRRSRKLRGGWQFGLTGRWRIEGGEIGRNAGHHPAKCRTAPIYIGQQLAEKRTGRNALGDSLGLVRGNLIRQLRSASS